MNEDRESINKADINIAYLIIRDYIKTDARALLCIESVATYFGCKITENGYEQPSPSVKLKSFGCGSVLSVSCATNIPKQTLRDWFITKPIAFHAIMLFSRNKL